MPCQRAVLGEVTRTLDRLSRGRGEHPPGPRSAVMALLRPPARCAADKENENGEAGTGAAGRAPLPPVRADSVLRFGTPVGCCEEPALPRPVSPPTVKLHAPRSAPPHRDLVAPPRPPPGGGVAARLASLLHDAGMMREEVALHVAGMEREGVGEGAFSTRGSASAAPPGPVASRPGVEGIDAGAGATGMASSVPPAGMANAVAQSVEDAPPATQASAAPVGVPARAPSASPLPSTGLPAPATHTTHRQSVHAPHPPPHGAKIAPAYGRCASAPPPATSAGVLSSGGSVPLPEVAASAADVPDCAPAGASPGRLQPGVRAFEAAAAGFVRHEECVTRVGPHLAHCASGRVPPMGGGISGYYERVPSVPWMAHLSGTGCVGEPLVVPPAAPGSVPQRLSLDAYCAEVLEGPPNSRAPSSSSTRPPRGRDRCGAAAGVDLEALVEAAVTRRLSGRCPQPQPPMQNVPPAAGDLASRIDALSLWAAARAPGVTAAAGAPEELQRGYSNTPMRPPPPRLEPPPPFTATAPSAPEELLPGAPALDDSGASVHRHLFRAAPGHPHSAGSLRTRARAVVSPPFPEPAPRPVVASEVRERMPEAAAGTLPELPSLRPASMPPHERGVVPAPSAPQAAGAVAQLHERPTPTPPPGGAPPCPSFLAAHIISEAAPLPLSPASSPAPVSALPRPPTPAPAAGAALSPGAASTGQGSSRPKVEGLTSSGPFSALPAWPATPPPTATPPALLPGACLPAAAPVPVYVRAAVHASIPPLPLASTTSAATVSPRGRCAAASVCTDADAYSPPASTREASPPCAHPAAPAPSVATRSPDAHMHQGASGLDFSGTREDAASWCSLASCLSAPAAPVAGAPSNLLTCTPSVASALSDDTRSSVSAGPGAAPLTQCEWCDKLAPADHPARCSLRYDPGPRPAILHRVDPPPSV